MLSPKSNGMASLRQTRSALEPEFACDGLWKAPTLPLFAFRAPISCECITPSTRDTKRECLRKYPEVVHLTDRRSVRGRTNVCSLTNLRQSSRMLSAMCKGFRVKDSALKFYFGNWVFQLAYSSRRIPSLCILDCRVVRFIPKRAAAPCEPETTPPV